MNRVNLKFVLFLVVVAFLIMPPTFADSLDKLKTFAGKVEEDKSLEVFPFVFDKEEKEPLAEKIKLKIRAVNAFNEQGASETLEDLDPELQDIKSNLKMLPFKKFSFFLNKEFLFTEDKSEIINISNGDTLELKVLYNKNGKVGAWCHWKDAKGMELLDTRLHFNCSRPLIIGAEHGGKKNQQGKILVINLLQE